MAAGAQGIIRARRRGCPALDLAALLETLPPELRELCHRLEAETVFKISRATGVPRGTLYGPIRKPRKICQEAERKNT